MTCKDCIHYDVCDSRIAYDDNFGLSTDITDIESKCDNFKDKSKFVELPCKAGEKLYDISELLMPQCYSPEMYIFDADDICVSKDARGYVFTIDGNDYRYEDFGKTVFLSKEAAIAKVAEESAKLKDNNNA